MTTVMTTMPSSIDAIQSKDLEDSFSSDEDFVKEDKNETNVVRLHTVNCMHTIPESKMEEICVEKVKEHQEEDISHQPSTPFAKKRMQETEPDEETSSKKSTLMISVGISVVAISVAAIFWLRRKWVDIALILKNL